MGRLNWIFEGFCRPGYAGRNAVTDDVRMRAAADIPGAFLSLQCQQMRILTVTYGGLGQPSDEELARREAADEWPRVRLYQNELNSMMLDEREILGLQGAKGLFYKRLPMGMAQALQAYSQRRRYDAIVSWGERFGLPLAALLKVTRARTPHIALFSWISTPKKAALLRRVQSHIHRLVVWSSIQYDFAVNDLGIPASRVVQLRWLVDQKFWRPMPGPTDMICAVGREMRDYGTLIEAIRDWSVPCHIATKVDFGKTDRWMSDIRDPRQLPPHLTFGTKPFPELRALYARSRFVVLPLYPTDTDNGVTAMTEAMAMGKAVICSKVDGQRDVLEHGVNGLFVPPRDSRALREAIEYLWNHPDECARMGREGRTRIERYHTLDRFVHDVKRTVEQTIAESRGKAMSVS
jgi:glycosyltransferase involved in cell wall biosynthesis